MRLSVTALCVTLFLLAARLIVEPAKAEEAMLAKASLKSGDALTAAELAQLLEAQVWKFEVSLPTGATHVQAGLSLKEKGHDARGFAASIAGPITKDTTRKMIIAIIPVGGTLYDADKVRVVISGFGVSAGGMEDNPLKTVGIGRGSIPEDNKDGSFNLIGGYKSHSISFPMSSADRIISLKIETSQK